MVDNACELDRRLSRPEASAAVSDLGWRYVLGAFLTGVRVPSLAGAAQVAVQAVAACAGTADGHLWLDLRPDRVLLGLQTAAVADLTLRDVRLAEQISAAVRGLGLRTSAETGAGPRPAQQLEIAIDALDIPAIRPFWQAVLGYADEPGRAGPTDPLVDPLRQGPAIWFQQMDAPRPQRNRIHFDISVPHDEAPGRLHAALAAGGVLRSDRRAPAFWVLADAEGNEACVTTWQGRD